MKTLIRNLVVMFVVIALVLLAMMDPGYVMIYWNHYVWEMAAVVFVTLVLVFIAIVYAGIYLYARLRRFPGRLGSWRETRRTDKASRSLSSGLVELAEGRWQEAEKRLLRYSASSETPLLNYLAAARAAQGQGAWERRDAYLKKAIEAMPDAGIAVGLTQAEMQLHHGQLEQALASAQHLKQIAPRHHYVTRLLVDIYRQLGDWRLYLDHLQELKKTQMYSPEEYEQQLRTGFLNLMRDNRETADSESLQQVWEKMPATLKTDEDLVTTYAARMIRFNQARFAEPVVRAALDKQWRESLVELYGVLPADPAGLLQHAQRWQRSHPGDPALLLTLGRLHLRQRIWGKARQLLEESISHGGGSSASILLSGLLERLGEGERAGSLLSQGFQEYIKEKETLSPVDQMLLSELSGEAYGPAE